MKKKSKKRKKPVWKIIDGPVDDSVIPAITPLQLTAALKDAKKIIKEINALEVAERIYIIDGPGSKGPLTD